MPDFFSSDIKSLVSPPLYSAIIRRLTLLDLQEGEQIPGPGQLIETCTPCQLFRIARQDYNLLLAEFPELYQLAFQIANKHLIVAEKRMFGLHMLTAYERYEQW